MKNLRRSNLFGMVLLLHLIGLSDTGNIHAQYLVKDSLMVSYLDSGIGDVHFVPEGKILEGVRSGKWKDYEVMETFACRFSENSMEIESGHYMVSGVGKYKNGNREGVWKLFLIEDKTFSKIPYMELEYANGEKDGPYILYYLSGEMAISGHFKNGELDGVEKRFYPNGNKLAELNYTFGLKEGKEICFYPSGKIKFYNYFKNDTLNGNYEKFYENGSLQETIHYLGGKIHGIYQFYYPNGKLWVEREYEKGKLLRINELFDKKGNPLNPGTLKNGNGLVYYYNEEGEIYLKRMYRDGNVAEEQNY